MKPGKLKRLAGYIFLGVFFSWLFLYLLFPAQELKSYLQQAFFRLAPEAELTIGNAETAFPLGLTLRGVSYAIRDRRAETIALQQLTISPNWLSLLFLKPQLVIAGNIYGGKIAGWIAPNLSRFAPRPMTVKLDLSQVDIGRCLYLQGPTGKKLTGTLAGSFFYQQADAARPDKPGGGQVELYIKKGVYHLPEKIAGLDKAEFKDLELKLDFQGRQIKISRLTLVGEGLRASMTGTLLLDPEELSESLLDMRGSLETTPGKRFALTITGKMGAPLTSLQ